MEQQPVSLANEYVVDAHSHGFRLNDLLSRPPGEMLDRITMLGACLISSGGLDPDDLPFLRELTDSDPLSMVCRMRLSELLESSRRGRRCRRRAGRRCPPTAPPTCAGSGPCRHPRAGGGRRVPAAAGGSRRDGPGGGYSRTPGGPDRAADRRHPRARRHLRGVGGRALGGAGIGLDNRQGGRHQVGDRVPHRPGRGRVAARRSHERLPAVGGGGLPGNA